MVELTEIVRVCMDEKRSENLRFVENNEWTSNFVPNRKCTRIGSIKRLEVDRAKSMLEFESRPIMSYFLVLSIDL